MLPRWHSIKVSTYNPGDLCSIPGLGRFPWRRKWQPTPVFLPGELHGQKSLAGYSPWGRKELDTTEQLHFPDGSAVKNPPAMQETQIQLSLTLKAVLISQAA